MHVPAYVLFFNILKPALYNISVYFFVWDLQKMGKDGHNYKQ